MHDMQPHACIHSEEEELLLHDERKAYRRGFAVGTGVVRDRMDKSHRISGKLFACTSWSSIHHKW